MNANNSDAFVSKTKDFFWIYLCVFRICIKFWTFSKKDNPHSLCISEITDHERRALINVSTLPFERTSRQASWKTVWNTDSVLMRVLLPARVITVKVKELQKSLLDSWKFFRPFLHRLTANDTYSLISKNKSMQTIQMHLSQKPNIFSQLFCAFFEFVLNFEHFPKKTTLIAYVFPKLPTTKDVLI